LARTRRSTVAGALASAKRLAGELLYERRYGVRTSPKLVLDLHDTENVSYVPINWRLIRRALPPSSVSERDVFLDLGSGMGRAVLEAAGTYPFARVVGIEFSQELHEIAQQNLATTRRRLRAAKVDLICGDLREWPIPDDVTVIFMNNAVRGSIFATVLCEISASMKRNPRPMRFIYYNPVEDAAMVDSGEWRVVRTFSGRRARWPYAFTRVYEWVKQT
jgi:SAM-dependent methyltransferase